MPTEGTGVGTGPSHLRTAALVVASSAEIRNNEFTRRRHSIETENLLDAFAAGSRPGADDKVLKEIEKKFNEAPPDTRKQVARMLTRQMTSTGILDSHDGFSDVDTEDE